jgi:putative hydrolase of the HAD superfamily
VRIEGEVGIGKPSPEAFAAALAALGARLEPAAMIGDDLEADVAGAERAGIPAVWVDHGRALPPAAVRPGRCIRALADLLGRD